MQGAKCTGGEMLGTKPWGQNAEGAKCWGQNAGDETSVDLCVHMHTLYVYMFIICMHFKR